MEDRENRAVLYAAIDQLPPVQARRVYAHYILGMSKTEIARVEGVHEKTVRTSIERGLRNMENFSKNRI